MMVYELVTNAARHAFGNGKGEIRVELSRAGKLVECRVVDNGSAPTSVRRGRGLMRFAPPGLPDPTETACQAPAITPPQENGGNDDLRNARLSLYSGPAASAVEALRDHHVEDLGEARHPAGRVFHDGGR